MEPINHSLLRKIKKDKTTKNKKAIASDETMLQFFYSKKNIFYLVRDNMMLFELGLWIKSMTNYVQRKNEKNHQHNAKRREIMLIDYGINVGDDISYEHPGVVIAQRNTSVYVVPCSTGKLRNAYEPNGDVKIGYMIGEKVNGFTKQTALVLYNAKWISKNSIILNEGNKVTKDFYDEITENLLKISLVDHFKGKEKLSNTLKKLDHKIERLNEIIAEKDKIIEEQKNKDYEKDEYILELEEVVNAS